jgi:quercetin dioxygenase-like cupin family protein
MTQEENPSMEPKVIHVSDAEYYDMEKDGLNMRIRIMLSANDTGGQYTFTQDTADEGFVVKAHYHKRHDEFFSIIEGEMEWTLGDSTYMAKAGSVILAPKGTVHAFRALTTVRYNMFFSPGGYEYNADRLVQLSPEDKEDEEKMKQVYMKNDVHYDI